MNLTQTLKELRECAEKAPTKDHNFKDMCADYNTLKFIKAANPATILKLCDAIEEMKEALMDCAKDVEHPIDHKWIRLDPGHPSAKEVLQKYFGGKT